MSRTVSLTVSDTEFAAWKTAAGATTVPAWLRKLGNDWIGALDKPQVTLARPAVTWTIPVLFYPEP